MRVYADSGGRGVRIKTVRNAGTKDATSVTLFQLTPAEAHDLGKRLLSLFPEPICFGCGMRVARCLKTSLCDTCAEVA